MCVTCIGWARKQAIYGEHGRGWSVRQGGRFVGNVCEPASHLPSLWLNTALLRNSTQSPGQKNPRSVPRHSQDLTCTQSYSVITLCPDKRTFKQACSYVHCARNSPSPPALLLKRFHSLSCSNSSTPESLLLRIASLNSTLSLKQRHCYFMMYITFYMVQYAMILFIL